MTVTTVVYSEDHIEKLREFFGDKERNEQLRNILGDFPDPKGINQLDEASIGELHIQVIKKLLQDIYLSYRIELTKWSKVTKQTAIVDPEYLSMHVVSLFAGVPGSGTAARGFDLSDGSEVKSCSRVAQLGKCKKCGAPVMVFEEKCGICGSEDVERKFDSHWIISLRTDEEVQQLLSRPVIYLVLLDYEDVEKRDIIRIRIWKLDPSDKFVQVFFRDYYFEEYFKKRVKKGESPAPCNLHPDKPLTKSLKPALLFVGKINLPDSKISIELIDSYGTPEKISSSEARGLLSKSRNFFKKVVDLGLQSDYKRRSRELMEESERELEEFMERSNNKV